MAQTESLRRLVHRVRAIPGRIGLRPYRVFIRSGTWDGTYTGDGTETATETELLENGQSPKVRFATGEQIALGAIEKGGCTIGPITPAHTGGGTSIALLEGTSLSAGDTLHVRLLHTTDSSSTYYRVTEVDKSRALHYRLTCAPVG